MLTGGTQYDPYASQEGHSSLTCNCFILYRVFARDVSAAMLVSLNKGTAAMLVSPTNPPEIGLYSYANVSFCFGSKTRSLIA